MAEEMVRSSKLFFVHGIQTDEAGSTIRFAGGGAVHLPAGGQDYDRRLTLLKRSLERAHPVGVSLGEGGVTGVFRTDNDITAELADEDESRVQVLFRGHDGVFWLDRKHPEYVRIRGLLEQSAREQSRVWFVAQKPQLLLLDARETSPRITQANGPSAVESPIPPDPLTPPGPRGREALKP